MDDADTPALTFAVLRSEASVQLDPFHSSVYAPFGESCPLVTNASELGPPPPRPCLALFKSPLSVHEVPSHTVLVATLVLYNLQPQLQMFVNFRI